MAIREALTISVLGLGVTFLGLTLTSLVIVAFSLVPKLLSAPVQRRRVASRPRGAPVPGDVLCVIATVLEVERRLYHTGAGASLGRATAGAAPGGVSP